MQISKLLSAVCATAFFWGGITVHAQDNPAQAAARAALMEKMSELDAQQNKPANATPPAIVVTASGARQEQASQPTNAAPTGKPAPAATENAVMTPVNPPASKAEKAAAKAKAKQEADLAAAELKAQKEADAKAAKQKAADEAAAKTQAKAKAKLDAQQAAAESKAKKQATAAAKVKSAPTTAPAAPVVFAPVPPQQTIPVATPPANQQPTATPPQAVVATPTAKPVAPAVAPAVKPVPPADADYAGKSLGLKPIEAPPVPVSAQKEAELQTLLAKYMANQISPDEYQKARAAILAEP
jgi:flagellar biosynthesis GTPase FlhF